MSSSVERYDVVIAGGGTAGLALACALADALGPGARIAVVDPAPLRAGGARDARAFALSAGAKRMLTVLGVWPELAAHAQPVTAIDITDSSLEDAFRPVLVSYDNTVDGSEPATYIVEHGRLRDAAAGGRRRPPLSSPCSAASRPSASRPTSTGSASMSGAGLRRAACARRCSWPPTGGPRRCARRPASASCAGAIRRPASSPRSGSSSRTRAAPCSTSSRPAPSPSCR